MTDHEHEWQYVQAQLVYEGFPIVKAEKMDPDDPEDNITYITISLTADALWQNVDAAPPGLDKVSCIHCNINRVEVEPDFFFMVEWNY